MARVFLSHASADAALADRVRGWLTGHDVFLDHDRDDGLTVGENWQARLHERLRRADAVVCLITDAYVRSPWCAGELAVAVSRGSLVLPVLTRADLTHPLVPGDVQYTLLDSAPDRLRDALGRIDATGGTGWSDGRSPYPGLRAFDGDYRAVFFGRDTETAALARAVRAPGRSGVLAVVGPSGSGKSSLVSAGLIPLVGAGEHWVTAAPVRPGTDPVGALARELARTANRENLGWSVAGTRERLIRDGLAALADELLVAFPGDRRHLLVVVDQFEEALTVTEPTAREELARALTTGGHDSVRLVATLRPEFLDQFLADPVLAGLDIGVFPLRPLRATALPEVIGRPAEVAGLKLDPALIARMTADTGGGEALPLLAYALEQLGVGARRGDVIGPADYDRIGGVHGALIRQADTALEANPGVLPELLRLVTVDEHGRPAGQRVPHTPELAAFVEQRLLTVDDDGLIGVTHEAFLSAWAPLRDAVAANVTALRARRAVDTAADAWQDKGRPPERLWGGGHLAGVVDDLGDLEPGPGGRAFLTASRRHDRWRRNRVLAVVSSLLVMAVVAAAAAVAQLQRAQEQTSLAVTGRITARSDEMLRRDPRTALRLGLAANAVNPGGHNRGLLTQKLLDTTYAGSFTESAYGPFQMVYAPDGRALATASTGGLRLWNTTVRPPRPIVTLTGPGVVPADAAAFTPDGRTLVVSRFRGGLELWDVADPGAARLVTAFTAGDTVSTLALTPDGRTLVTGGRSVNVQVWDIANRAHPRVLGKPLTGDPDGVTGVAVSPDGRLLMITGTVSSSLWDLREPTAPRRIFVAAPDSALSDASAGMTAYCGRDMLATGTSTGDVILWTLSDPRHPVEISRTNLGVGRSVTALTVNRSCTRLAAGSTDRSTILLDVSNPSAPARTSEPLGGHSMPIEAVAFSPSEPTLLTSARDGVTIWDLEPRTRTVALPPAVTEQVRAASAFAIDPHDQVLVTHNDEGDLQVWDLTGQAAIGSAVANPLHDVADLDFGGDGDLIVTLSRYGGAVVWTLNRDRELTAVATVSSPDGAPITAIAVSQRAETLVTVSDRNGVTLWSLTQPAAPRPLPEPWGATEEDMTGLTVSPDGRRLGVVTEDGTVDVWDVNNPRAPLVRCAPERPAPADAAIVFSPDGSVLATGSAAGDVVLHRLSGRRCTPGTTVPAAHTARISHLAFDSDGATLVTVGYDSSTSLWDVADPSTGPVRLGTPLTTPDQQWINATSGSGDRFILVGADYDSEPVLYDYSGVQRLHRDPVGAACAAAGGGLTRAEWDTYLPEEPYRNTCSAR